MAAAVSVAEVSAEVTEADILAAEVPDHVFKKEIGIKQIQL